MKLYGVAVNTYYAYAVGALSVVVLVLVAAGAYLLFSRGFASGMTSEASPAPVVIDGKLTRNGVVDGPWRVASIEEGAVSSTLELSFDENSICAYEERSGRCKPSVFIEGRGARVEGDFVGATLYVQRLTFTEPPPEKARN